MATIDKIRDYYHINAKNHYSPYPLMKPGDIFDIGGKSNPFFNYFEKNEWIKNYTDPTNNQQFSARAVEYIRLVSEEKIPDDEIIKYSYEVAKHFVRYLREIIWEKVRVEEFPHLPSRQRCIWLIPNMEGVDYWKSILIDTNSRFKIVKVKGQGRIHTASQDLLLGDSEPMDITIQKARMYWLGVIEREESSEVIFEGRLSVLEEIESVP